MERTLKWLCLRNWSTNIGIGKGTLVMAVCDFDMRFTFVVPGWPGSVHDTCVWSDAIVRYEHFPQPPAGNILYVRTHIVMYMYACIFLDT